MISANNINCLKREVCGFCTKQIFVGQSVTICKMCDLIFHGRCVKLSNIQQFRDNSYCASCFIKHDIRRYNPFYNLFCNEHSDKFYDDEPVEFVESVEQISKILENCSNYDHKSFNKLVKDFNIDVSKHFTTFFLNIDGNNTNFDQLVIEMERIDHKFSIIGLAETNIDKEEKDLYQLTDDYTSIYQSNIKNKKKGIVVCLK